MAVAELKHRCFLIGQMSTGEDKQRLRTLRDRVLEPFLKELGYQVVLPDEPSDDPAWFRHVMTLIDTSQILVADLTGDNANAYYELAIRHSLGLPYVLVCEHAISSDIRGLSYVKYEQGRPQDARESIEDQLAQAHQAAMKKKRVRNPIVDFYGAPLTEVSPATGLALGYYRYLTSVVSAVIGDADTVEIDARAIGGRRREKASLQVWIPNRLADADPDAINSNLVERDPPRLVAAKISVKSRDFNLYAEPKNSKGLVLVDVPRTMTTMEDVIGELERARRLEYESPEWLALVRQEIERFRTVLYLQVVEGSDQNVKKRVRVTDWPVPVEEH